MQIETLMLIDDNSIDQMLYARLINRSGIVKQLIQYSDADSAMKALREAPPPSAILLDINMPRINGFEFLENAVAEFGDDFSVVVVMLSTSMNPEDSDRAKQFKLVKDYYNKPLDEDQLHQLAKLVNS